MAAPKGNEYYKIRTKDGRDTEYTPEELLEKANEYFTWCIENPLKEELVFHAQGIVTKSDTSKMRPFTIEGLAIFAGIMSKTFRNYEQREEFLPVTTRIRDIIENQQFEGAASGFLNPNIIARKLGLADKQESTGSMSITWNEEKSYE